MQLSRQQVVERLRKVGLFELAQEAMRDLPDPVELEDVREWGMRHGITSNGLMSLMGGSP